MLTVSNISKSYVDGGVLHPVLSNISLTAARAEVVAIVGKSGSGKSTLLNIVASLDYPDQGSVWIEDTQLSALSPEQAAQFRLSGIGLVFQFFNFLPTLSIAQNVSLPGYLLGRARRELEQRTVECLHYVGIERLKHRLPHEVSGGELQRAAVARALFNRPALLLADEPTGNLDEENALTVFSLFLNLARETQTTTVLITHDRELANAADRVLVLSEGTIESDDAAAPH